MKKNIFLFLFVTTIFSVHSQRIIHQELKNEILFRPYDLIMGFSTSWLNLMIEHNYIFSENINSHESISVVIYDRYFGMSIRLGLGIKPLTTLFRKKDFLYDFHLSPLIGTHYGWYEYTFWYDFSVGGFLGMKFRSVRDDRGANSIFTEVGLGYEYYLRNNLGLPFFRFALGIPF